MKLMRAFKVIPKKQTSTQPSMIKLSKTKNTISKHQTQIKTQSHPSRIIPHACPHAHVYTMLCSLRAFLFHFLFLHLNLHRHHWHRQSGKPFQVNIIYVPIASSLMSAHKESYIINRFTILEVAWKSPSDVLSISFVWHNNYFDFLCPFSMIHAVCVLKRKQKQNKTIT